MKTAAEQKDSLDELLPLILGAIRQTHSHLNKKHRQDLVRFSSLQIHALGYIKENKNPLMREVADFLAVTPPSATSLIEGLVCGNMLKRVPDEHDRRAVRLALTKKGRQVFHSGFRQMIRHMRDVYGCLNNEEKEQMINIYRKINNYFKTIK